MLELPALTTRMVSVMAHDRIGVLRRAGYARKHRNGAGGHARAHVIGARREDDRHARAEHDARSIGVRRGRSGSSPACCRLRDRARPGCLRRPATWDLMPLMRAASGLIALSKASGPSSMPPVIWPRSAILHSAAASMVEGMFDRDRLDGGQDGDLGRPEPEPLKEVDGVLHDVALGHQVGEDVHGSIGDEQRLRMIRHVHDEDVADAPARPQTRLLLGHCGQQLIGVQAALHQELRRGPSAQARPPSSRPLGCAPRRRFQLPLRLMPHFAWRPPRS